MKTLFEILAITFAFIGFAASIAAIYICLCRVWTGMLLFALLSVSANAQSVTIRIVSNDGSLQATNAVALGADKVSGLLSKWNVNSGVRTNAGLTNLTFGVFILQELTDKGVEWTLQAGTDAIKAAGVTNNIPPRVAQSWFTFSTNQQNAVVSYLNAFPQ